MRTKNKGFSLLEISIVLVIIGALFAVVGKGLLDKKSDTRKVLRDFMVAGKDLRGRAKLNAATYRLAFQLDEKNQAWWVEKSSHDTLIDKKKYEAEREQEKNAKDAGDPEKKTPPEFQPDTSIFKKKQTLPPGYRFKQVESGSQDTIVTDGMAYIHFFSQGMIETSAFQIEDPKKNIWTIIYNPLTGQTDIIPEAKELKDLAR